MDSTMTDYSTESFDSVLADLNRDIETRAKAMAELAELEQKYKDAQLLVQQIYQQKQKVSSVVSATTSVINQKQHEVERQRRLREAKIKRDRLQAEFEERAKAFDINTSDCIWRTGLNNGFQAMPHQIDGAKRLAVAKRGILADKRGLGKTLTSIAWLDMLESKRILILAPNDIVPQFEEEIRTWAPYRRIFSLRGLNPVARKMIYPMLNAVDEFIVTLNYEAWRKDKTVIDDLVSAGIDTIVCDEAHKIKSSDKITARGVFQIAYRPNYCDTCKEKRDGGPWYVDGKPRDLNVNRMNIQSDECGHTMSSTVTNVLTMTGTPILNKPQELFSLLYLVDSNTYPSEKAFLDDYCYSPAPNRWKFLFGGLDRLTRHMSSFFVQRTREDAGIMIPPPAVRVYKIEKDKVKYAKQYKAEHELRNAAALTFESGDAVNMLYILEILLRERQIMTWPAGVKLNIRDEEGEIVRTLQFDVEESQKLDEATELLTDLLEEEERVIVFSKFKAPLYEMNRRVEGGIVATGDQPDYLRRRVVEDFDLKTAPEKPRWQVAFCTYDAFATGLNLNAARHIIMLDDEWNPGMEDQAIGRIDRLNSTDQANVHIFRVKDSIDDFMADLLEKKREMVEGFESDVSASDLLAHIRGE